MKVTIGELHEDFSRDTYWARVFLESDDGRKRTTLLTCASHEYLWDLFKSNKFTMDDVRDVWLKKVIDRCISAGDSTFNTKVLRYVYAMTDEGRENGMEFLEREISP